MDHANGRLLQRCMIGWLRIAGAALFLTGATCSGMSSGNALPQQPELELEVLGTVQGGAVDSTEVVESGDNEAVLAGVISTPTPCYEISGTMTSEGRKLVVTLEARALPRICAQVLAAFQYRARIAPLGSGEYRVEVVHAYPGTGWEGKRYELVVTVPD